MTFFILCFVVSLLITLLLIRSAGRHGQLSADHDLTGVQKFHARAVPRVGGIGIYIALLVGAGAATFTHPAEAGPLWLLIAAATLAFAAGLTEDITKNVSPGRRLLVTTAAAALAIWLFGAMLTKSTIPGVDWLLQFTAFQIFLTLFMVAGVANAVNIIDGFNGLASMCVLLMVLAITYVAFQVGDTFLVVATLVTAGAVLGFFVWNFPAGLIFLGDGGAYLLGFLLGELSVLLLHRNSEVSPLFPLLLCAYPIFETIFSVYRKKFLRKMSPGMPDGVHLHMLVYKRLMRWAVGSREARARTSRNSMTSPYLWLLCLLSVIPSLLWWNNTAVLAGFIVLFMVTYVVLYWRIVRFRSPKWMVFRKRLK